MFGNFCCCLLGDSKSRFGQVIDGVTLRTADPSDRQQAVQIEREAN